MSLIFTFLYLRKSKFEINLFKHHSRLEEINPLGERLTESNHKKLIQSLNHKRFRILSDFFETDSRGLTDHKIKFLEEKLQMSLNQVFILFQRIFAVFYLGDRDDLIVGVMHNLFV